MILICYQQPPQQHGYIMNNELINGTLKEFVNAARSHMKSEAVVMVSRSWLQRRLKIGFNLAGEVFNSLIEHDDIDSGGQVLQKPLVSKTPSEILNSYSEVVRYSIIKELYSVMSQETSLFGDAILAFIEKIKEAGYPGSVARGLAISTIQEYAIENFIRDRKGYYESDR